VAFLPSIEIGVVCFREEKDLDMLEDASDELRPA